MRHNWLSGVERNPKMGRSSRPLYCVRLAKETEVHTKSMYAKCGEKPKDTTVPDSFSSSAKGM